MNRVIALFLAAGVALANSSCGTVCNLAGGAVHPDKEPRVYGGIQRDMEVLDSLLQGEPPHDGLLQTGEGQGGAILAGCIIGVCVADPLLSFVADTLTLPITIPLQQRRLARESEPKTPTDASRDHHEPAPISSPAGEPHDAGR